MMQTITTR